MSSLSARFIFPILLKTLPSLLGCQTCKSRLLYLFRNTYRRQDRTSLRRLQHQARCLVPAEGRLAIECSFAYIILAAVMHSAMPNATRYAYTDQESVRGVKASA